MDVKDEYGDEAQPETCCGCIEIGKGMKIMGVLSILNSLSIILEGVAAIYQGITVGFVQIIFNLVVILQAYWFFVWFRADTRLNRENVTRGYKYVVILNITAVIVIWFLILGMPLEYLPNEIELPDEKGHNFKKIKLDRTDKQNLKRAILVFQPIIGFYVCFIQYYFYSVSKRWSTMQKLLPNSQ